LKRTIRRILADNLGFILASLTYILAHILDYHFTVRGLRTTVFTEGNPIIQGYIDHFGIESGLVGYKLLICIALIFGMKAIDLARKEKKTRFRVEPILYVGAILTIFGGSLWFLPM
jgi:hypothetical protein